MAATDISRRHVFVSYASEQRAIAAAIVAAIGDYGHTVFFDKDSLPAGSGYHARIARAIRSSDVFVFLTSPESVQPNRYTITEVDVACRSLAGPEKRILPVMVAPTDYHLLPARLKSITAFTPSGNVAASVADQVDELIRSLPAKRRRRWTRKTFLVASAVSLSVAAIAAAGFMGLQGRPDHAEAQSALDRREQFTQALSTLGGNENLAPAVLGFAKQIDSACAESGEPGSRKTCSNALRAAAQKLPSLPWCRGDAQCVSPGPNTRCRTWPPNC